MIMAAPRPNPTNWKLDHPNKLIGMWTSRGHPTTYIVASNLLLLKSATIFSGYPGTNTVGVCTTNPKYTRDGLAQLDRPPISAVGRLSQIVEIALNRNIGFSLPVRPLWQCHNIVQRPVRPDLQVVYMAIYSGNELKFLPFHEFLEDLVACSSQASTRLLATATKCLIR